LRETGRIDRVAPPGAVVIFGSTGDLSHRKLMPALYNLAVARLLPAEFAIVAFGRRPYSDGAFRAEMREAVARFSRTPLRDELWESFSEGIVYVQGDLNPAGMAALKDRLAE